MALKSSVCTSSPVLHDASRRLHAFPLFIFPHSCYTLAPKAARVPLFTGPVIILHASMRILSTDRDSGQASGRGLRVRDAGATGEATLGAVLRRK